MSHRPCTILLLEDEAEFVAAVERLAQAQGWRLLHAASVAGADRLLASEAFDIVLADRLLGGGEPDGLDLIERMRKQGHDMPVIVLSSLGSTRERVRGLETGADAYLPKPWSPEELAAQIAALLRRRTGGVPSAFNHGALAIFPGLGSATWSGERLPLTPKTFTMLALLAENPGQPVSNEMIWQAVWPKQAKLGPQRAVIERMVKSLRRILVETTGDGASIGNERGRGYFLAIA
jgi:DNA-binding response OmpR family regulator